MRFDYTSPAVCLFYFLLWFTKYKQLIQISCSGVELYWLCYVFIQDKEMTHKSYLFLGISWTTLVVLYGSDSPKIKTQKC